MNGWQGDGWCVEVDAFWPSARLAVELDSYGFHSGRRSFQRDREKGNHLTAAGFTVLRFAHSDVTERPKHVADRVAALLDIPAS